MGNMFKSVKAKNVNSYLKSVPKERKVDIVFLHKLIPTISSKLKPHFAYNMLGYGKFKYKNYKKEVIDWPVISLANQKNYISLYVCALEDGEYIAEKYKDRLGKVGVGKSCIRFKSLDDVNLKELKEVIKKAARSPGLAAKVK